MMDWTKSNLFSSQIILPVSLSTTMHDSYYNTVINNKKCRRRDLNPRPFGIEPESTALDHSATSTLLTLSPQIQFYPRHTPKSDIFLLPQYSPFSGGAQINASYIPVPSIKIIFINNLQSIPMKWCLLLAITLISLVHTAHPEAKLQFVDYCKYYNYPVQTHKVITEDGYILTVFRIQRKASLIKEGLKPIILQHGLLDSSDTWLVNDEDKAPGFMLANKGYDVWMGNSRGNKHSRNHTKYNPDKNKEFWEFTFQHMADFDLPALFTYVNNVTKQKPHYIGHSQGTIQMHIALAKRNPVVEGLIDKYFGFGPVAYVKNAKSHVLTLLDHSELIPWYHLRGIHEFMPGFGWFETDIGIVFCSTFGKICGDIMTQIMDGDASVDNYERYDVLVGHDPSGTSVMNMQHWKQSFDKGTFQAYDYGSTKQNNAHYGQPYPPKYDLANIRVPMRLFAGVSDLLADITDVNFMWDSVKPQVKKFIKVYNAGHCTFMWGNDVAPWMNDVYNLLAE